MIDRNHDLPITRQAEVLQISRGSVYYLPRPVPDADLAIMRRLDRLHLEFPFAGSRMLRGLLAAEGCKIGRRHVKTLMRRMGMWRSVKYEEVYLRAYESVGEARNSIGRYLDFYNGRRPHQSLDDATPDQAYFNQSPFRLAA